MDEALLSLRTELARERGLRTTAEAALRRCGPRTVAYRQRDARSVALLHQKLGVLNSMLEAAQTEQRESLAVISALNAEMETLHRELETERVRNRVLTMRSSSSTSSSSSSSWSSSSSIMTPRVQSKSWRSAAPQRLERPGVGDGAVDGPMTPPTTPAESPPGELASGLSITSDNEELAAATLSEAQHQLHKAAQHQHHDHDHDHSGGANGGASSESSMVELAAAALSAAQHQHQNRCTFAVVDGEVYSAGEQSSDDQDSFVRGLSSEDQQSSSDFFALVKDTCGKENTLHHRSTCGACVLFLILFIPCMTEFLHLKSL